MSDAEPVAAPRKLPIWWILAGVVLLLVGLFLFQLFAANSAIVVSKETTFITEPLGDDGLPDFSAYFLEQDSEGVTPENNAAVLVWQATWPGELEQEDWLPMVGALGMKEVPSGQDSLVAVYDKSVKDQIAADLTEHYSRDLSGEAAERLLTDQWQEDLQYAYAEDAIDEAMSRPWTSEQLPSLAQWVEANQGPLDMLVEAANRPNYFSPSPSLVNGSDESLIMLLLPGVHGMRSVLYALQVRAMGHLGAGRTDEAWTDILACYRLARHLSHGRTLIEQLIGIAMNGVSCRTTVALMQQENLSELQAAQILADLQALPPVSNMTNSVDQGERLLYIDTVIRLAQGKMSPEDLSSSALGEMASFVAIDWNHVLKDGNRWYDRIEKAARLPTYQQRQQEFTKIDNDLMQMSTDVGNPKAIIGAILSRGQRSQILSNVVIALMIPAFDAAKRAEDRGNTRQQLTITAAALAVYRAKHGQYPETLNELVPAILPQVPLDLYTEQPFIYQRKDPGGYLFYSVSDNGTDDGGTNRGGEIINGEWTDEQPDDFDSEATDEVIRVPQPGFEFPELPVEELENQP